MTNSQQTYRRILFIILAMALITGCKKDSVKTGEEPAATAFDFIPAKGHKYEYKIEEEGGDAATAVRWISGENDSLGLPVYDLRTDISAAGMTITLNDRIFDNDGKTFTELQVPDAWYQAVQVLGQLPGVEVKESTVNGYPAYLTMENSIQEGSKVEVSGPANQSQYIMLMKNGQREEISQALTQMPGTAKVETITVPAGTYVCNRFTYNIEKVITTRAGGQEHISTGTETVDIWMAHGIGMVKSENEGELLTLLALPGGTQVVKTSTRSVTTLEKID